MDKLPKVFQNPINHNLDNDQKVYTSFQKDDRSFKESLNIDDIFKGKVFIYKRKVLLILDDNTSKEEYIVSRNSNSLITINNEKILISKIKNISFI